MSEEKNKTIRDEETLARVLEAAYVMQEHNRELRKTERAPALTRHQNAADQRPVSQARTPQAQSTPLTFRPDNPRPTSTTLTLAQIVEIQHQVQVRHLELKSVMALVAERLSVAAESAAAIGILEGQNVHYRATAGAMAPPAGTKVPIGQALSAECLRTGHVLRCCDTTAERSLDTNECSRRGIQSILAVPIFREGRVAGTLDRYFSGPQAFAEEEVHTCQLMAGLVSEALARDEDVSRKRSFSTERSAMLEALEKLKPSLAALADFPLAKDLPATTVPSSTAESRSTFVCGACGHELIGQEQFCGNCGSPRHRDNGMRGLQSKIASLWHMGQALELEKTPNVLPGNGAEVHKNSPANRDQASTSNSIADSFDQQMPETIEAIELEAIEQVPAPAAVAEPVRNRNPESAEATVNTDFESAASADLEIPLHTIQEASAAEPKVTAPDSAEPESTALARTERSTTWSSAATALDFFQQLRMPKDRGAWAQFWNSRRGDIYLTVAVILLLFVVWWGIWSGNSVSATGSPTASAVHHKGAPTADLSLFDRILVKLGVAEAPEPPADKGNPATQVWVDLHTALYYCPGADLYGKTTTGRFSSQRAAQLDQFEPAYRKPCD